MREKTYRSRRLGIAAGLAALAALLTMLYVSRAQGGTTVEQPCNAVSVLVATKDLSVGTSVASAFADGSIAVKQVPATSVAADSVRDAAALRGEVVVQPVYAHEQLSAKRFGTTGEQGMRSVLRGSLRAITIAGDARQLLAAVLRPGDHVDLVVNDRTTNPQNPRARVALQNLVVLEAPGGEGTVATTSDTQTLSATLELTDKQTQVLWWAVKNGDWSLVLRPASKAATTASKPATAADVWSGVTR